MLEVLQMSLPVRVADGTEITVFEVNRGKSSDNESSIYLVGYSANTDFLGEKTVCTVENSSTGVVFTVLSR
jgi:hypothetical protein